MRWQPEEPDIRTEILTVSLEKAARYEQEYEEECSRIPTPTEKELLSW